MDILGIGMLELIVILVIALVVLGPAKTVKMARDAGKMLGEFRRAFGDLSRAMEEEERELGRSSGGIVEPNAERENSPEEEG